MKRKHHHHHNSQPHHIAPWLAIGISQPHTEEDVTRLMNETRAALVRFLEGTAEDLDLGRLGMDINVAWVRAQSIGNSEPLQKLLEDGGNALAEARGIKERHGRYGLTGPGRIALGHAVDAFEAVLRASSPRQMQQAENEVTRLTRKGNRDAVRHRPGQPQVV